MAKISTWNIRISTVIFKALITDNVGILTWKKKLTPFLLLHNSIIVLHFPTVHWGPTSYWTFLQYFLQTVLCCKQCEWTCLPISNDCLHFVIVNIWVFVGVYVHRMSNVHILYIPVHCTLYWETVRIQVAVVPTVENSLHVFPTQVCVAITL